MKDAVFQKTGWTREEILSQKNKRSGTTCCPWQVRENSGKICIWDIFFKWKSLVDFRKCFKALISWGINPYGVYDKTWPRREINTDVLPLGIKLVDTRKLMVRDPSCLLPNCPSVTDIPSLLLFLSLFIILFISRCAACKIWNFWSEWCSFIMFIFHYLSLIKLNTFLWKWGK